jgi:uncharacterized radical SAM protein YgiQ
MAFLPLTREEMRERGVETLDFICVTGDAYVDHPSFGIAIISRVIESMGFAVGVIAQPRSPADFTRLGRPAYAFMVTSGNIDSMVAHYTAALKKRSNDCYSPGNKAGLRPDRAVEIYCKTIRELYPDVPIVIGGLEASLRRFAHYDYWSDGVKPSILRGCGADLLVYGMGERQTMEICSRLENGENIKDLSDIRGTAYLAEPENAPMGAVDIPSLKQVSENRKLYARACRVQHDEQDEITGKTVIQRHGAQILVQNPPMPALTAEELDFVYALPYERTYHPAYEKYGGVPAAGEVRFSITHNRGCFGGCNFCSLAFHQGRRVTARSKESIVAEAKKLVRLPDFKGNIHDVGGPTANFRHPSCEKQLSDGLCRGKKCLVPKPCERLRADHREYLGILRELRGLEGVKRVFVRSGVRYDYILADKSGEFLRELTEHHVSGQLKVAPEHCAAAVLDKMGKPRIESYLKFQTRFYAGTKKAGKEQYLVPYLMSSHPGCTLKDAAELALFLKNNKTRPEQVQDFYPTPGTVSACMYHTGLDPYTSEPVYVPKTREEKSKQRALLQYYKPQNKQTAIRALREAGRGDLVGKLYPDRFRK